MPPRRKRRISGIMHEETMMETIDTQQLEDTVRAVRCKAGMTASLAKSLFTPRCIRHETVGDELYALLTGDVRLALRAASIVAKVAAQVEIAESKGTRSEEDLAAARAQLAETAELTLTALDETYEEMKSLEAKL